MAIPSAHAPPDDHIYLKAEYQLVRVALSGILYAEGLRYYVQVHPAPATRPLFLLTNLRSMKESYLRASLCVSTVLNSVGLH